MVTTHRLTLQYIKSNNIKRLKEYLVRSSGILCLIRRIFERIKVLWENLLKDLGGQYTKEYTM